MSTQIRQRRLRRVAFLLGLVVVLAAGVFALVAMGWFGRMVTRRVQDARSGPVHAFPLGSVPRFLSDEVALEKARQTLAVDGYDISVWQPVPEDRSHAPDGTADAYLLRNTIDPNHGTILFRDATGKDANPARIVQLELKGDHVECQVVVPK